MGNIIAYLKWRGDISFLERPFNEVDNLIFSMFVYLSLKGCVPEYGERETVTVESAYRRFCLKGGTEDTSIDKKKIELFRLMAQSRRFSKVRLSNYLDIIDFDKERTQFAAICCDTPDGYTYVAYRGTDNTIVGWREDFCISFQVTPAQQSALEYFETIAREDRKYRLGGHSKGGNVAIYAAMMCKDSLKEKIETIYSNDGPGMCSEMIDTEKYHLIQSKIKKFVPEFAVIGKLFEEKADTKIVGSRAVSFSQHDAMTWRVEGDHFIYRQHFIRQSKRLNHIFDKWIENQDMEHRKSFTEHFFSALGAGGAKYFDDLKKGGVEGVENVIVSLTSPDKKSKHAIGNFIEVSVDEMKKVHWMELVKNQRTLQGIAAFLMGMLFIVLPEFAQQILGNALFIGILVYAVYRLYKFRRDKKHGVEINKKQVLFYGLVTMTGILCIALNRVIILSANIIIGGFFVGRAYRQGTVAAKRRVGKKKFWPIYFLDALLSLAIGIATIAMFNEVWTHLMLISGTYLILEGIVKVGQSIHENALLHQ